MFDIGLSELLLIAVAALIFIGPRDLPNVLRDLRAFWRELHASWNAINAQMSEVLRETEQQADLSGLRTLIDLEGKPQIAYDVREIAQLRDDKPADHAP